MENDSYPNDLLAFWLVSSRLERLDRERACLEIPKNLEMGVPMRGRTGKGLGKALQTIERMRGRDLGNGRAKRWRKGELNITEAASEAWAWSRMRKSRSPFVWL